MSNTRKATGARATKKTAPAAAKATPPKADLCDLLGEDTRPEKVVPLCLRGHLQAEWDRLKAEYDAGPGPDDQAMMAERANKRRIAEQMGRVEAEMRAGTVEFRLRALPRRRTPGMAADQVVWHELVEKHPPRKDDKGKVDPRDAGNGFNVSTLFEELVPASVVDPPLTDAQWEQLTAKLTHAQWLSLMLAAINLNCGEIDVPFSRAASIVRTFDAESRRQSDSASPSNASTAGSRSTSRSTTTTTKAG